MVKNHSDSERGNPLPPHGQQGLYYHPTDSITHTTTFVTPVLKHWLEREMVQCCVRGRTLIKIIGGGGAVLFL